MRPNQHTHDACFTGSLYLRALIAAAAACRRPRGRPSVQAAGRLLELFHRAPAACCSRGVLCARPAGQCRVRGGHSPQAGRSSSAAACSPHGAAGRLGRGLWHAASGRPSFCATSSLAPRNCAHATGKLAVLHRIAQTQTGAAQRLLPLWTFPRIIVCSDVSHACRQCKRSGPPAPAFWRSSCVKLAQSPLGCMLSLWLAPTLQVRSLPCALLTAHRLGRLQIRAWCCASTGSHSRLAELVLLTHWGVTCDPGVAGPAPPGTWGMAPFFIARGPCDTALGPSFSLVSPTVAANALRVLRALQLPKALLLEGSPGVGKTSLVGAIARASGGRQLSLWAAAWSAAVGEAAPASKRTCIAGILAPGKGAAGLGRIAGPLRGAGKASVPTSLLWAPHTRSHAGLGAKQQRHTQSRQSGAVREEQLAYSSSPPLESTHVTF